MFPFRFIAPNYIIYKSCGSYSPLRQDLEQSSLLTLSLQSDSHFLPLSLVYLSVTCLCSVCSSAWCVSAWCVFHSVCFPLGVFSAWCGLSLVCFRLVCFSAWCVSPLGVSCCLSHHSHFDCPIIADLPIHRPRLRSKGPQFQSQSLRSLSFTLIPSSPGL